MTTTNERCDVPTTVIPCNLGEPEVPVAGDAAGASRPPCQHVVAAELSAPTTSACAASGLVPGAEAFLNPQLYSTLFRRFGQVRVINRGKAQVVGTTMFNERPSPDVRNAGETYTICCPWCRDFTFHFRVPHGFGTIHEATGRRIYYAKCFKCQKVGRDLFDLLGQAGMGQVTVPATSTAIEVQADDAYKSPGECVSLLDPLYPGAVKACGYLAGRGIDPRLVSEVYGWKFCTKGDPNLWSGGCANRLIMPVTRDDVAVGWQARLAFDPPPLLKDRGFANLRWLTMPGAGWRSKNLIGYDQAKAFDFCILVEGPTDMARQGPPCIGSLGQTMSHYQYELIASTWGTRSGVIVMGDAGDNEDRVVAKTVSELSKRCACPIFAPRLPEGDPGSWEHQKFVKFITDFVQANPRGSQHRN